MQHWITYSSVYLVPTAAVILFYWASHRRKSRMAEAVLEESLSSGLSEPASLHPVIDPARCLGCATCVQACPESRVLGITRNKARLITPAACIGHGACQAACPTDAIQLVFGTETRGIDIPVVRPDFQTNVEGIYIAGELGGMGLIRNAIEQGRQAVASIAQNGRRGQSGVVDLAIIGAGPAGISAAMAAKEHGISYQLLDQDSIGGTIAHYPRGKVVMTAPAQLPIIGEFHFGETSKEDLMAFWLDAVKLAGIEVTTNFHVEHIRAENNSFTINDGAHCRASNVLLTIGRRGTPRRLGVPGEELSKVVYRLVDPEQYRGQQVLVVGGGDSALEAALDLAGEPGTEVTLCYRGEAFNRVKKKNRDRLGDAERSGKLKVALQTEVTAIEPNRVTLITEQGEQQIDNEAVIICAGGVLPTAFLEDIGIEVQTHFGKIA